ncbi:MAG: hypothetical protein WD424_04030 [Paenibacillaceae bacterium]
MNISQLLRGVVGSAQPVDAKALEFKIGQVVKGIVLQLLAEQDAMVNIGGVPIRARLETPLQIGQMTLLQVQPESSSEQIVLKPLGSSNIQILETSLPDLVKSFGLKDTDANRTLLQQLHTAAIPLNAKTIKAFQPTGNMAPITSVPLDQWTEAAIVAYKKGLPLKSEVVLPLQQVMFGKPLPQSLEQLKESLQRFIQAAPLQEENSDTMNLVRKLIETISGLTMGRTTTAPAAPIPLEQGSRMADATARIPQADAISRQVNEHIVKQVSPSSSNEIITNLIRQGSGPAPSTTSPVASATSPVALPTASVTAPAASPVALPTAFVTAPAASVTTPVASPVVSPTVIRTSELAQQTTENQSAIRLTMDSATTTKAPTNEQLPLRTTADAAVNNQEPWIKHLLKQLGVDYEHRTANVLTQITDSPNIEELQFRHESVKGLLLQLASADNVPSALKETMQQVVQQITGQQLLLGGERGSAFSLVTLFVPIQHENGTDTASVHIQSKRKQGGNLDTDNCRLLFDLRMSTLGDTLVDVQVVNRIVSLQVHNDFPMIGHLLETLKPEMETAMNQIGFQFISMKHVPYPDPTAQRPGEAPSTDNRLSVATTYHSKPYKGMDLRI